jgi:pyruvate dehydrogenase complex dehydrogenase (E1) component
MSTEKDPDPRETTEWLDALDSVIEFEGTSVTSRSTAGSDNIAKNLGRMWRSVWD